MHYSMIPAPAALQKYIKHFWVLEGNVAAPQTPSSFRTLADGTPGFIFQNRDRGTLYQFDKKLPGTFLYGQATRAASIQIEGDFDTVGIFFQPYGLKAIFGIDAGELTDDCQEFNPYQAAMNDSLAGILQAATSREVRIHRLISYIEEQIVRQRKKQDAAIMYAAEKIWMLKGNIDLHELRAELFLTERSFERKFKQYIGLPPKMFARIAKFQSSLHYLRTANFDKLSDIAYLHDYTDQSHFIRNFKEFAGCSPLQLQQLQETVMDSSVTGTL
ncbi:AraC family transcriptional regulator [Chitinophaga caeni]|uniref:AraC family transcriptional regulator n=1 Tax=Chitinophaga caeni TaxID=2029983 RepID=A0A291R0G9_9BACT|nr:DUF6597 domain-containing transcriptional factor [Chitinophaga caeni]ATL49700.1 AraC family transcriptional regulator [Chitinophaga caeni]